MDDQVTLGNDIENISVSDSFICSPENSSLYLKSGDNALTLLHLNIRSINCNFDALLVLLHRIQSNLDKIILPECSILHKSRFYKKRKF